MLVGRAHFLVLLLVAVTFADDRWVWRQQNRQERAFKDTRPIAIRNGNDRYRSELYAQSERQKEREPTTKRPLPGEIQSDDIDDDYPDNVNINTNVGTRQYPFAPPNVGGFNAGQLAGAGGFGAYPTVGGNPGILVGPGGPTGVIGRPQQQFPIGIGGGGGYQPGFGGFNSAQTGLGFPGSYAYNGLGSNYPAQGYYPVGSAQPGLGPYAGYGQFPGTEFGGNQFAGVGAGQYPTSQFGGAQFPNAGPQFTAGYGLAYNNGQFGPGPYGTGIPAGLGYDENTVKSNSLVAEGKSAKLESNEFARSAVDDKVNKVTNNS